ncbi:MAG: hypothetical protein Q8S14_19380 [Algoriphagus sp.]|uniref:hypothetical protein n=1 Tax=Algoriphagus sp. TaxID=1872435 RepID=UPI00273046C6|nr:hypothetical protein [Algoriphagus sp.]MDP2042665.1 hypothetical protein [Algoriphagus sp.]MDP3474040.1 hypothetical protein [Algoriphagus sp.]
MRNLIFLAFVLLFWSCEMQPIEELAIEPDTIEQIQGPYQVTPVSKSTILSLGKKLQKRIGFNVIESAQMRQISDFTFDLEASQLTTDTLKRRTYTVPFLEKGDKYSTFNLVMVADSVDNVLDQYVLQYEFDSIQYQDFEVTKDLFASGVTIKRFPFSSFFNDSNPGFLERCDGIFDSNGDPVTCDEVEIISGPGYGGGGSSGEGTVWITPGGGGGSGMSCSWILFVQPCNCKPHHTYQSCGCEDGTPHFVFQIICTSPQMRTSSSQINQMTCMDCSISDFGSPAFTLTRDATQIDNLLSDYNLTDWHMAYLSNNSAFSSSLKSTFLNDPNLDQDAGMFTISAAMNGALTGNFNNSFILAVEGLMDESEGDLTQDPIRWLFQYYFEVRYAILKQLNSEWSNEKLFYETAKEAIHLALDGIGLIPGLGEPADLLNSGLYFLEGDRLNASLSLIAATPVIGWFSTTAKGALRLKGIIPGTSIRITQVWAKDGNKILFGGTRLRKAMGLTDPSKHAHHILPLEHANHPVIQKAAKGKDNPFHIQEIDNGVAVDAWQNTNHPAYNDRIKAILDN